MIKKLLLIILITFGMTTDLSTSFSIRTPNDVSKPLDYELSVKLEDTEGKINYLLKQDWERELGEKYKDVIVKFKYKSPHNAYCGVDWVDKNTKDIHYTTYNLGFYTDYGFSIGIATKLDDDEMAKLANIGFGRKFKKDDLEYNINISIKSDLDENNIFNVKSDVKKWITERINIFGLYKHEYYNEQEDFQFKVGLGFKL